MHDPELKDYLGGQWGALKYFELYRHADEP